MAGALRLGLIGAGRWGRTIIKTIDGLADVHLTRLASGNPDSKALVGERCIISDDWRTLTSADDLDGIIIATPPALHADMASAAMNNAIPVLIEKPLTIDATEARALLALAQEKAAIVLVDHIHLYHPAYVELKRLGLGMGPLHAVRSAGGDWGPFRRDASVLWDRASHDVALCLDLLGEELESVSARRTDHREVADGGGEAIAIKLNFPGGVTADIESSNLMDHKKRFLAAHYDHETLIYDDESETPLVCEPRPTGPGCDAVHARVIDVEHKAPLGCVLEAFAGAIRRGDADISGLELGVRVVAVLGACDAALRDGGKTLNFRP